MKKLLTLFSFLSIATTATTYASYTALLSGANDREQHAAGQMQKAVAQDQKTANSFSKEVDELLEKKKIPGALVGTKRENGKVIMDCSYLYFDTRTRLMSDLNDWLQTHTTPKSLLDQLSAEYIAEKMEIEHLHAIWQSTRSKGLFSSLDSKAGKAYFDSQRKCAQKRELLITLSVVTTAAEENDTTVQQIVEDTLAHAAEKKAFAKRGMKIGGAISVAVGGALLATGIGAGIGIPLLIAGSNMIMWGGITAITGSLW